MYRYASRPSPVPSCTVPGAEGAGRLSEPDTACGDGERMVGGYGRGALEMHERAER